MFEFIITGGISGMLIISFFGLGALIMASFNLVARLRSKVMSKNYLDAIIYLGGMALFFGLFWDAKGLYEVLSFVHEYGEVPQTTLAHGLKVSLLGTLWGGTLFIISYLSWLLLKVTNKETN